MVGRTDISRCCCVPACRIFFDGFNRAASTNIGVGWTEDAGEWVILGTSLAGTLFTDSSDAIAIAVLNHPDSVVSHWVRVDAKGEGSNDQPGIYIAYVDDTEYLRVEFEYGGTYGGSSCGTLKLIQDGNVLHEIPVRGVEPGDTVTLGACYQDASFPGGGELWGSVTTSAGTFIARCYATGTGLQVGLGTGPASSQQVTFDNFDWRNAEEIDDDNPTGCPECFQCTIWATHPDYLESDCLQNVDGTPFDPNNIDDWEIESLINASDADEDGDFGIVLRTLPSITTPDTYTLILGNYTATFERLFSPDGYRVTLTGPGISETKDLPFGAAGVVYDFRLSAFGGSLVCASVSNLGSVVGVPSGAIGRIAIAQGTNGVVDSVEFTRCPSCSSQCGCGEQVPTQMKVEISGITNPTPDSSCQTGGPGSSGFPSACGGLNGTFILPFNGEFQTTINGTTYNVCSWQLFYDDIANDACPSGLALRIGRPASSSGPPDDLVIELYVLNRSGGALARYTGSIEDAEDCEGLEDVPLTYAPFPSFSNSCDWDATGYSCLLSTV